MANWFPIIIAVITVGVPAVASVIGKKGDGQNQLIDQLQEQVAETRTELKETRDESLAIRRELDEVKTQLLRFMNREMIWRWHTDQQNTEIVKLGGDPLQLPSQLREEA